MSKSSKSEPKPEPAEEAPAPVEGEKKKKKKSKPAAEEAPAEAEPAAEPEAAPVEKKKKKKKVVAEDAEAEAPAAAEATAEEVPAEEAPKKKKKKKVVAAAEELADGEAAPAAAAEEPAAEEAPKKKKKKKVVAAAEDEEAPAEDGDAKQAAAGKKADEKDVAAAAAADEPEAPVFSLPSKKKKKKVEDKETEDALPWDGTDRDYSYTELMERIFTLLREKNPNLAVRKRHVMPPPQLVRVGTRKTMWANFAPIFQLMHRSPEHLMSFILAELGTEGSIDANQRFIMKGRYLPKQIESLLKKYIVEYVTCHMCRNPETSLTRDSVTRLYFIQCESCGSRRSVAPIKSGFHATSRSDRRKVKETK